MKRANDVFVSRKDGPYNITPKDAISIWETRVANRNVNESSVSRIKNLMLKGRYVYNGETLIFDEDTNELADGQHRIKACMETGCSFTTYCVWIKNAKDILDFIDSGKSRSVADAVSIHGRGNASARAALARMILLREAKARSTSHHSPVLLERDVEIKLALTKNIGEAVAFAKSIYDRNATIPPRAFGYLYYIVNDKEAFKKFAEEFAEQSGTGPAKTLSRRLVSNRGRGQKLTSDAKIVFLIKAWNAHFEKKPLSVLKWSIDEEWPEIKG